MSLISSNHTFNNLVFELYSNNVAVVIGISNPPNIWNLIIPSQVTYSSQQYNVLSVNGNFISPTTNRPKLYSVVIPNSVTSLGTNIFANSDNQDNTTSNYNNLTSVIIGTGITKLPTSFFTTQHIRSYIIPSHVTETSDGCFSPYGYIQNLYIPDSVTKIGGDILYASHVGLTNIRFPSGLTEIPANMFRGTYLGEYINFTIPAGVTDIGNNAFYGSGLTRINIPYGVTRLGVSAFDQCPQLTHITFPNTLKIIEDTCFVYSGLTNVTIPYNVTSIGHGAFSLCQVKNFELNAEITEIPNNMFSECFYLTNIIIPNTVNIIRSFAFYKTYNLSIITFPSSILSIDNGAFEECSIENAIFLGTNIPTIGNNNFNISNDIAFVQPNSSGLSNLTPFFSNITEVENFIDYPTNVIVRPGIRSAIISWSAVTVSPPNIITKYQVSYYNNFTFIVTNVDTNTTSLTIRNIIPGSEYTISVKAFVNSYSSISSYNVTIIITDTWSNYVYNNLIYSVFDDYTAIIQGVTNAPDNWNLTIPNQIYYTYTDNSCNVISINDNSLQYLSTLKSVIISDSVTYIGNLALRNCNSLQSITLPINESYTKIKNYIFYECSALTSVTIPSQITSIEIGVFGNCTALSSVTFASLNTLKYIKYGCFEGTAISNINIPDSVTNIESNAFSICNNLTSVTFVGDIPLIEGTNFSISNDTAYIKSSANNIERLTPYFDNVSIYYYDITINAPQNVSGTASVNSAIISWSAVTVVEPYTITKYQISYYNITSPSSITTVDVSGNVTQSTITELTNFQTYEFSVKAFFNTLSSEASSTVQVTPVSINAPQNVIGIPHINSATISWNAVSASVTITKYQVSYYNTLSPSSITTVDVSGNVTQKIINGLNIRNSYNFSVKAFVNSNSSVSSNIINVELSLINIINSNRSTQNLEYNLITAGFTTQELLDADITSISVTSEEAIQNLLENYDFPTISINSDIVISSGILQSTNVTINLVNLSNETKQISNE
jgi:hypothetical protein